MNLDPEKLADIQQRYQQKIVELRTADRSRRELGWLPFVELGPFTCAHLSLDRLFLLQGVGNLIATGRSEVYAILQYKLDRDAAPHAFFQIAQYLWVLQPAWQPGAKPTRRFKRQVKRWIRQAGWYEAFHTLEDYQARVFKDVEGGGDGAAKAYTYWLASYVHRIAQAYGWAEREILALPIQRVLEYHRQITISHHPDRIPYIAPEDEAGVWQAQQLNALMSEVRTKSESSAL